MKVGDHVEVTKGTHPLFGRRGKVLVVMPGAMTLMVDLDDGGIERIEERDVGMVVRPVDGTKGTRT